MKTIRKLSIKDRREIWQLYHNSAGRVFSAHDLANVYQVPVATVYNILSGRVKMDKGPRKDKGTVKGPQPTRCRGIPDVQNLLDGGAESRELLEMQTISVLTELGSKRMNLIDRTKVLSDISRIQRQLKEQEIESHIKRADAQVIARIVRRFLPTATDADVIKIFREELDKWKNEN